MGGNTARGDTQEHGRRDPTCGEPDGWTAKVGFFGLGGFTPYRDVALEDAEV